MSLKYLFCLSGYGYLHEIVVSRIDGYACMIARVKVVTHYDASNSKSDDVIIDCEIIEKDHVLRLNDLDGFVRRGREVLINFKAEYASFVEMHSCLDNKDPSHIIILQAKLRELNDCFVDSQLVEDNLTHLPVVA